MEEKSTILDNISPKGMLFLIGASIILIVLAVHFILPILTLCISLTGFAFKVSKRFWVGILSILSIFYLWFDTQKEWIVYIIVFGDKQTESMYENGIFKGVLQPYINYIYIANFIGLLIAIVLIIQSYKYNKS